MNGRVIEYEDELWAYVPGYEGLYLVSNQGRVMALNYGNKGKCKILKLSCNNGRYIKVGLRKDGKTKTFWLHILVALAFVENPEGLPYVDHIDGQKLSNNASNLRFVSAVDNARNPATIQNYHRRYHREGEWERRSKAQKKRFAEHPEDVKKMQEGKKRKRKNP